MGLLETKICDLKGALCLCMNELGMTMS